MAAVKLNTYLINLDRAKSRLENMQQKLAAINLPIERIAAVDGALLTFPHEGFSENSYRYLHMRKRTPPEIGCYFSHIQCARLLLESDASHALILEDDVSFNPEFRQVLDLALADDSWDILRLSTVSSGRKLPYRKLGAEHKLAIALTREKGAGAYVINRRAAVWLTKAMMPMRVAYDIAFDVEYLYDLRASFISPPVASQISDADSQIQNNLQEYRVSKWHYFTAFPFRFYLEFWRPVLRGFRLLKLRLKSALHPSLQS